MRPGMGDSYEGLLAAADPRPAGLLADLDGRIQRFFRSLPDPLAAAAVLRATYVGGQEFETLESLTSLNPLIACCPWLFWELFGSLQSERFLDVAEAGACLSLASGIMDKLVDGEARHPERSFLLQEALRLRAQRLLRRLFPSDSEFWPQFDRLAETYWHALNEESNYQSEPSAFTEEAFVRVSGGKVSPIVVTIAALAALRQRMDVLEPIERSFRWTFAAGQLHDDILDSVEDSERGHVTFFTRSLLRTADGSPLLGRAGELRSAVERTWADVDMFDKALEFYDHARDSVNGLACTAWNGYLDWHRQRALQDQTVAAARHLRRILEAPGRASAIS
jgi:hypothetical protein